MINDEQPEPEEMPKMESANEPEGKMTLEEAAANRKLTVAAQNMGGAMMKHMQSGGQLNALEMQCNIHLLQAQLDVAISMLWEAGEFDRAVFWERCAGFIEKTEGNYRRATLNQSVIARPGFRQPKKN